MKQAAVNFCQETVSFKIRGQRKEGGRDTRCLSFIPFIIAFSYGLQTFCSAHVSPPLLSKPLTISFPQCSPPLLHEVHVSRLGDISGEITAQKVYVAEICLS